MLLDRFHSTNIKARLHIATLSLDRRCEGFSLFQIKAELKLGVVKLDRYTQNLVLEYQSTNEKFFFVFGDNTCSTCLQPIFLGWLWMNKYLSDFGYPLPPPLGRPKLDRYVQNSIGWAIYLLYWKMKQMWYCGLGFFRYCSCGKNKSNS